ncbi:hypothetical protein ABH920_003801 [Catenulispora sp. EB89]
MVPVGRERPGRREEVPAMEVHEIIRLLGSLAGLSA